MEHPRLQLMGWKRRVLEMYAAARADGDLGTDGGERLVLDLNDAYDPSCSYEPRWSCPSRHPRTARTWRSRPGDRPARWY